MADCTTWLFSEKLNLTGNSDSLKNLTNSTANVSSSESIFHWIAFNVSHFPSSERVLFAQLRVQTSYEEYNKIFEPKKIGMYFIYEESPTMLTAKNFDPSKEFLFTVNVTMTLQEAVGIGQKVLHFGLLIPESFADLLEFDTESPEGPQLLVLSKRVKNEGIDADRIFTRLKRSLDQYNSKAASHKGKNSNVVKMFNSSSTNKSADAISPGRPVFRQKRSEEEDEEVEEQSNYIVEELGRIRKGKLKRKKNPCRRKPLHVNFAAINYDQWIIAPPSYEAFECTGKCSFPMSAHLAPTKHAIIQTLMHSLEPKQVSRASCVPIKLAPISILYVDDDGTVTYKYDYEDMVVAECGCR